MSTVSNLKKKEEKKKKAGEKIGTTLVWKSNMCETDGSRVRKECATRENNSFNIFSLISSRF